MLVFIGYAGEPWKEVYPLMLGNQRITLTECIVDGIEYSYSPILDMYGQTYKVAGSLTTGCEGGFRYENIIE